MFVICREDNKYYSEAAKNWVEKTDLASKFKSITKAENYIKSTLPYKGSCRVVDEENLQINLEEANAVFDELQEMVEKFGKIAAKIPMLSTTYAEELRRLDKLQQDLLHEIEFMPSSNILFIKLARQLKKCRIDRRDIKNRRYYLASINAATSARLLEIHKSTLEGLANQVYGKRGNE